MNPQDIQSNVPTQPPVNMPTPITLPSQPTASQPAAAPTGNLDDFITQSKAASQSRFQSMVDTLGQHGFIFNPTSGQFERDPAYVDPATAYQLQLSSPAGQALLKNTAPINDSSQLNLYVDANGNTPPIGSTGADLASQGYKPITTDQKQMLDGLTGAQNVLDQIAQAYNSVIDDKQSGSKINPGAKGNFLGGLFDQLGNTVEGKLFGKTYNQEAQYLTQGAKGDLTAITSTLLQNKRYNESEMNQLQNNVPSPTDDPATAAKKLATFQKIIDSNKSQILQGSPVASSSKSSGSSSSNLGSNSDPLGIR